MTHGTRRWRAARLTGTLTLALGAVLVGVFGGSPLPVFAHPAHRAGGLPPDKIVSRIVDSAGHTHITYASGVQVTDGDQASLPTPAVTGKASADWQAFVKNGYHPVVTPLFAMVQSTSGFRTEVSPPVVDANCVQSPAHFNIATASASDLARYGLPALPAKGMTRAQYNQKYAWMKHRVCSFQISNVVNGRVADSNVDSLYAGNVADQNPCSPSYTDTSGYNTGLGCIADSPYIYTEADSDWYIPSGLSMPINSIYSSASSWVGVGGVEIGSNELTQAGVTMDDFNTIAGLATWIEYVGNVQIPEDDINLGATWGTHFYAKVSQNNYTIGNINNGDYYTKNGFGPYPDDATAEFIVERNGGNDGLADFGSINFKGMGVTEQSLGYKSMSNLEHDYFRLYDNGLELAHVNSIVYDGSDYPYDDNSITWENACNGYCV